LTDSRSDLWSLAATLYQMVTGKSPRIIRFNDVPQSLQDVLGKALEDEKDDRYQAAAEFRDALRASQQDTDSEELEEGSCPSCGTKNPTNRKFCRNADCGASLEVPCLSCSFKIPMWEEVCNDCGKPQGDLLQQRRDSMVSSQSEAESLLKVYDFDRASELATALRDEPDLRLQQLKGWAEKFLPQIDQGRQQQLEQIGGQLTEAAAHEQAHDHAAGLRVLEKVPEILREAQVSGHSDTVAGVMSRLQSTLQEIKQLDTEIRQRVESRKVNGLQSEVNQLLELQPDRKDISKLKTQLLEREQKLKKTRDEAYTAAKQKLSAQDYDGTLKEIARIDESILQDAISQLRDEAIEKRDRLKTLRAAISEGVKTKQLYGLLKKLDECLSLKSDDAELQKLRDRLQAREEKNVAQVASLLEKAQSLREECQFEDASKALGRVPQELVTQEASDLLEDCDYLAGLRETAMQSLKSAMDADEFESGLAETRPYRDSLESDSLKDAEFASRYRSCQQAFQEQAAAAKAWARRGALAKKLSIAGAAVTAVVLLIAGGLSTRSSMRASALADAVEQQNWDEALAIDGQHVPALIGRAKQRLNAETPDIEGAFADIGLAEQVDSTASELKPAKALAHAKKVAVQQAAAEKVAAEKVAAEKTAEAAMKAIAEKAAAETALTLMGHLEAVYSVKFSPDGKRIVSGSEDNTLKVWDAQTGQELLTLKGHSFAVSSVSFSPDGKRIVSGSSDKTVRVWDLETGQETLKEHSFAVSSVSFSPDGKRIVSGSEDNTLKVWDAQTGQETLTLKGHSGTVFSVSFSPDGKRIVSGSWDKTLKVWDAQTGQEMLTLKGHSDYVRSVSFSPDRKRIVSGSDDNSLKIWDAQTAAEMLTLKGHSDFVQSVSFSPDGKRIVSGSSDKTVRIWDLETGQETLRLKRHSTTVYSVSFSPDGKRIVSGSSDGEVKVWDISSLDMSK
jgi:hypothetical protein